MAGRTQGNRSRSDITRTVEQRHQEYGQKTDAVKRDASDIGVEREAIEGLEALGTEEGIEAAKTSLREAEEISDQEFSDDGAALEQEQTEGREFEGELDERAESSESDLQKMGEARGEVHSESAVGRIEQAETQTREDIEFLRAEESRGRESREDAEREHEELKQFVHGASK